jgi:hypothetical protein
VDAGQGGAAEVHARHPARVEAHRLHRSQPQERLVEHAALERHAAQARGVKRGQVEPHVAEDDVLELGVEQLEPREPATREDDAAQPCARPVGARASAGASASARRARAASA